MQDAKTQYDSTLTALNQQGDQLFKQLTDPNAKIDPNHFWADKSTGSKIAAAIGIVLSGIGSGITRSPNAALQIINSGIDRDINAQLANLSNKQTLLSQNLARTRDLQQAKALTFAQLSTIAAAKANQASALAMAPEAQAKGAMLQGQLLQQAGQAHMGMAANQAMMSLANNSGGLNDTDSMAKAIDYMAISNPKAAEDYRARLVPGVGMANIAVPDKVREELIGRQDLQSQLDNLRAFAQKHEGSLDPAVINEGNTLANAVQDAYRRANGQGVFRKAEKEFVNTMVNQNPTAFFNKFRVDPQYKAVEYSNQSALNKLKQGYGLRSQAGPNSKGISFKPIGQ
jgi:hypothetical protein